MLDSLNARERSYDNSANGINFTIKILDSLRVAVNVFEVVVGGR